MSYADGLSPAGRAHRADAGANYLQALRDKVDNIQLAKQWVQTDNSAANRSAYTGRLRELERSLGGDGDLTTSDTHGVFQQVTKAIREGGWLSSCNRYEPGTRRPYQSGLGPRAGSRRGDAAGGAG